MTHASPTGMKHVLFIETGFGDDQHGQNATKVMWAAERQEMDNVPICAKEVEREKRQGKKGKG